MDGFLVVLCEWVYVLLGILLRLCSCRVCVGI